MPAIRIGQVDMDHHVFQIHDSGTGRLTVGVDGDSSWKTPEKKLVYEI